MRQPEGRLYKVEVWHLSVEHWDRPLRYNTGEAYSIPGGRGFWSFEREVDAVAFARRKGIKIQDLEVKL